MRALTTLPTPPYLSLGVVSEPVPSAGEALVRVRATSVNRGEVLDLAKLPQGSPAGWDVAGVVEQSPADGSGPAPGTRVVGLVRTGAWAELVAVPTGSLVVIPANVSFEQAATLPSAGLTALTALQVGGLVVGSRVLVTGARGGVGRFAVQLAALSGADVTAFVRDARDAADVRQLGAADVVESMDDRFDVIIDGVGGAVFGQAIEHLAPRGVLVNLATQDEDQQISFRAGSFDRAKAARIHTFNLHDDLPGRGGAATGLSRLCRLMAAGRLDGQIHLEADWRDAASAVGALLNRQITGKAVLHMT